MSKSSNKLSQLEGKIWFNGEFVPWQEAKVHVLSHGLHYGTGVFEGVRAYATPKGPAIFRLRDHTTRLFNSAKIVSMELPYGYEELIEAQLDVVAHNNLSDAYIRPLAFYDDTSLGLTISPAHGVNLAIAAWDLGPYLGEEGLKKGIDVCVSSLRRPATSATMLHAKICGNYINSVLAKAEAASNGYAEALLLDQEGYMSEGSGENLFALLDGVLTTPTLESALTGITRDTVMGIARELGIPLEVRRIARDELYCAEEAFLTGTAAEVTPIASIDRRPLGAGSRGPVTERLQAAYFATVTGEREGSAKYLSYIDAKRRKAA